MDIVPFTFRALDTATSLLLSCRHITTLNISSAGCSINLIKIASYFPHLETLVCSETKSFHGSLALLHRLRKLHMDGWDNLGSRLPVHASSTLTHLTLTCDGLLMSDRNFFDIPTLEQFTSLVSLNIGPLNSSLATYLLHSQLHLQKFGTSLIRHLGPIDLVTTLFGAPCLRTITQFNLGSNFHEDPVSYALGAGNHDLSPRELRAVELYWRLVFDAFTSILLSVEQLQLDVPLHVECCAYLSRMTKLKLVNWDGLRYPYFDVLEGENPKEKVLEALERAFSEQFIEKPQFAVDFIGD